MDLRELRELTAPCGLDCFNCPCYLANDNEELRKQIMSFSGLPYEEASCEGCQKENGNCLRFIQKEGPCKAYKCVSSKGIKSCAGCSDFPCDNLYPYADCASILPHNIKIYNLALIRKMGLEKWAQEKAKLVRETYFTQKFDV